MGREKNEVAPFLVKVEIRCPRKRKKERKRTARGGANRPTERFFMIADGRRPERGQTARLSVAKGGIPAVERIGLGKWVRFGYTQGLLREHKVSIGISPRFYRHSDAPAPIRMHKFRI